MQLRLQHLPAFAALISDTFHRPVPIRQLQPVDSGGVERKDTLESQIRSRLTQIGDQGRIDQKYHRAGGKSREKRRKPARVHSASDPYGLLPLVAAIENRNRQRWIFQAVIAGFPGPFSDHTREFGGVQPLNQLLDLVAVGAVVYRIRHAPCFRKLLYDDSDIPPGNLDFAHGFPVEIRNAPVTQSQQPFLQSHPERGGDRENARMSRPSDVAITAGRTPVSPEEGIYPVHLLYHEYQIRPVEAEIRKTGLPSRDSEAVRDHALKIHRL